MVLQDEGSGKREPEGTSARALSTHAPVQSQDGEEGSFFIGLFFFHPGTFSLSGTRRKGS